MLSVVLLMQLCAPQNLATLPRELSPHATKQQHIWVLAMARVEADSVGPFVPHAQGWIHGQSTTNAVTSASAGFLPLVGSVVC
jgi:hypothetical protein